MPIAENPESKEIVASRGKPVDQSSGFEAQAAMLHAGWHDKAVTGSDLGYDVADCEPEPTALYKCRLHMVMIVKCAFSPCLGKAKRHNHQIWMVGQHLPTHVWSGVDDWIAGHGNKPFTTPQQRFAKSEYRRSLSTFPH